MDFEILVLNVRSNVSIDLTLREDDSSKLWVVMRRVLLQYGYSPDKQEAVVDTVLEQSKLFANEWAILSK